MHVEFLLKNFERYKYKESIIWKDNNYTYENLLKLFYKYSELLKLNKIEVGSVVAIKADFSPNSISLLLSLINNSCIIVPLSQNEISSNQSLYDISKVEYIISFNDLDKVLIKKIDERKSVKLYKDLREKQHPGLVLFSSGSSGSPKAAVHDFILLLNKFRKNRKVLRTLLFLSFDHWGGLNTMFHILSNSGLLIHVMDRTPKNICSLIEKYKIELLPVSPTFLNLLLLSHEYKNFNLKSLKIISYGTEPMPQITLKKMNTILPNVKLLQTYGLIELGVLQSKSESNNSLWFKVGGDGYETRIINGILQIKANSAMLGYLNASSPFTDDGWFITGDEVLTKGEYIKVLGRKSEIINIGGEKVFPQEVENVILELEDVIDVEIYGESNTITGRIVCAKILTDSDSNRKLLKKKIIKHCKNKLESFKIPIKFVFEKNILYSKRFKKKRKIVN